MSARKDDMGKPPLSLIPRSALLAEARVMAKGKAKYGAHNWRSGNGMAWSRLIDATMRHLLAFADGEDVDNGESGSGELHLANARCCLAFLIEYYEKQLGQDDRHKPGKFKLVYRNTGIEEPAMHHVGIIFNSKDEAEAAKSQYLAPDCYYVVAI